MACIKRQPAIEQPSLLDLICFGESYVDGKFD
jgi:hypothetical protein